MQTELTFILKLSPMSKLFIVLLFCIHLAISHIDDDDDDDDVDDDCDCVSMQTELTFILKLSPMSKLFIVLLFCIHLAISRISITASTFLLDGRFFLLYGWLILVADLLVFAWVEKVQRGMARKLGIEHKKNRTRRVRGDDDDVMVMMMMMMIVVVVVVVMMVTKPRPGALKGTDGCGRGEGLGCRAS
jgi:hypothetical protein